MPPLRRKPFLRDYADQATPLIAAIKQAREDLVLARQEADDEAILALLGPLAEHYRALGQLEQATTCAEDALTIARALGKPRPTIANLVRLATAWQYRHEHERAEPLFLEAIALARATRHGLDTALQHHGKSLAEQGRYPEALACLEEALALRAGNEALRASTQEALDEALARQANLPAGA